MPDPYTFTDPDGDTLTVGRSAATGAVRLHATDISDGNQVYITLLRKNIDDLVAAMYRRAGALEPTFVLKCMPGNCRHDDHGVTVEPSPVPAGVPGNAPGVFLRTSGPVTRLACDEARHIAWHLMLHAQQAEDASKPKPATVHADAAKVTSFFADATDEEISAFLARFEITERTHADDLEASRAGAYQAGGNDL